ncbi:MAG: redoxin domain-containing protein [SAR202 cluster bacterium]|nr:redoxin domain-containing protein [SAR202 cluster bacterium]|tara:strand:- start:16964 stop:17074 length:111 start_codon:yes stop_codon:yes gene_type:complete
MGIRNPSFKLPALDNEIVDLEDYFGKKIILFMWASW